MNPVKDVDNNRKSPPPPIEIYVSCPWAKRGKATVPMRQDKRWAFLRGRIRKVIDECYARIGALPGQHKPDIRLHRLRGRQGMNLLITLRDRIDRADVLVMDLAGGNANVLLEVGMAMAMHKAESGALIILKPKDEPWPSNLQGLVYCNYDKSLRRGLEDQAGFRAALRTQILKVAKEREMMGA
jgi:hypothetical protein